MANFDVRKQAGTVSSAGARIPPRPPEIVMAPDRAAAAYPNALSFARSFVRKMQKGRWPIARVQLDLDDEGRGQALYRISAGDRLFHFFVISDVFPADQKIDRAFGINWDVSAAICEGPWSQEREAFLQREVPKQYDGRYDPDVLCFARGNRSERIFDHVVDALAAGGQPDTSLLASVGYLLRSTAFAGNGLFGMKPFEGFTADHPLGAPYHAQMLAAYMMREFVFDLAERIAVARNPHAAKLDRAIKRYLGLGNSAGLGLVPFIMSHPQIIHQWCLTHEEALAECLNRSPSANEAGRALPALLRKAITYFGQDQRDGNGIFADYALLASELTTVLTAATAYEREHTGEVARWGDILFAILPADLHPETVEIVNGMLLELYPDIVETSDRKLRADEEMDLQPVMSVGALRQILAADYGWLLQHVPPAGAFDHFWYYPLESPYEPRRGRRGTGSVFEFETAMDMPMQIPALARALELEDPASPVGLFIAKHPEFSTIAARAQSLTGLDYAELRINSLEGGYLPFAACRFLLSFYGMEKYDPRPPRATKGALLQGAPLADEISAGVEGSWPFPLAPDFGAMQGTPPAILPLRLIDPPEISVDDITPVSRPGGDQRSGPKGIVIFPMEARKLLLRACLGRGLSLRTAEAVARLTLICETVELPVFDVLLDLLEKCPGGMPVCRSDRLIDGIGLPDFAATAVLDLACARAAEDLVGIGVAVGRNTRSSPLVHGLANWGAQRGFLCAVALLDRREITLGGSDHGKIWTARVTGAMPAWAAQADGRAGTGLHLADGMLAQADWRSLLSVSQDGAPGDVAAGTFAILCSKRSAPSAPSLADISACARALDFPSAVFTPEMIDKARSAIDAIGITLTESQFGRLSDLAKKALVPEAVEKTIIG